MTEASELKAIEVGPELKRAEAELKRAEAEFTRVEAEAKKVEKSEPIEIVIYPQIKEENKENKLIEWTIKINSGGIKDNNELLRKICEPIVEAHTKERVSYWEYEMKKIEICSKKTNNEFLLKISGIILSILIFLTILIFSLHLWISKQPTGKHKDEDFNSTQKQAIDSKDSNSSIANITVNNYILECQDPKQVIKTTKKQSIIVDANTTKNPCKAQQ